MRKTRHHRQLLPALSLPAVSLPNPPKGPLIAFLQETTGVPQGRLLSVTGYQLSGNQGNPPIIPFVPFLIISEPEFFFFPNHQQPITQ
jgi:hypothetical protein